VPSYAQIGERCLGRFGKVLVTASSIFEIFVAILCMNIIVWTNAQMFLPWVQLQWIILGCVALSFPTNWLRDFEVLAFLSTFGLGCILLIAIVVVYNVLEIPAEGLPSPRTEAALPSGVPMSASIMLAGLTGSASDRPNAGAEHVLALLCSRPVLAFSARAVTSLCRPCMPR
jgi:amino acid permease